MLYPTAPFTLLRGALVGGAQAVWLLSPAEPSLRQERGLCVAEAMYVELRKLCNEQLGFKLTDDERSILEDQTEWVTERIAEVKNLRKQAFDLKPTEFVAAALDSTFDEADEREHGRTLWRTLSADAHVLGWSLIQRASFEGDPDEYGVGTGLVGGDLKTLI